MLQHEDGNHQTYVERNIDRPELVTPSEFGFNFGIFYITLPYGVEFEEMFTFEAEIREW